MNQSGSGKANKDKMKSGYNWRQTLTNFAAISGTLAGFSVTFIALMLSGRATDTFIGPTTIRFGQIAILLLGFSTGLFVCAAEFFLHAKEFDVFSIPDRYWQRCKDEREKEEDVLKFEDEQTRKCRYYEKIGRRCYNISIFIVFGGLFFAIVPTNFLVAFLVSGLGIALEAWQMYQ
jgi:hypothetical protein